MSTPEHFGTIKHLHEDGMWRTWHVYADVNELQEIEYLYTQLGYNSMPTTGISLTQCNSKLLKNAVSHVEEELMKTGLDAGQVIDDDDWPDNACQSFA